MPWYIQISGTMQRLVSEALFRDYSAEREIVLVNRLESPMLHLLSRIDPHR
jgi:hypothetical protein